MSHVDEGELTAYADGAYAPEDPDALRIAAHLAECVNCRNRLAQTQTLSARASDILAIAAPAGVQPPPFEEIAGVSRRRRRFPAIPLTWAATVILALGIGWFGRGSVTPVMRTVQAPAVVGETARPEPAVTAAPTVTSQAEQQSPPARPEIGARRFEAPPEAALSTEVARDEVAAAPPPPVAHAEGLVAGVGATANSGYHMIPNLELVSVRTVGDSVHVQQKLPDGVVITLTSTANELDAVGEARPLVPREQPSPAAERQRTADNQRAAAKMLAAPPPTQPVVFRGGSRIFITGPLSADSLRALVQKVR